MPLLSAEKKIEKAILPKYKWLRAKELQKQSVTNFNSCVKQISALLEAKPEFAFFKAFQNSGHGKSLKVTNATRLLTD